MMGNPLSKLLPDDFEQLTAPLIRSHSYPLEATGTMDVIYSPGCFSVVLGRLLRLPPPGENVPVHVIVTVRNAVAYYTRAFGSFRMCSRQHLEENLLVEKAGPATFRFAVSTDLEKILYIQKGFRLCGIDIPSLLSPSVRAIVSSSLERDRWHVLVEFSLPFGGVLCRYSGWMKSE